MWGWLHTFIIYTGKYGTRLMQNLLKVKIFHNFRNDVPFILTICLSYSGLKTVVILLFKGTLNSKNIGNLYGSNFIDEVKYMD
jgi:hypothetical protein